MSIVQQMRDLHTRNWWANSETAQQLATQFAQRVEADGGVVEAEDCLAARIQDLKDKGIWNKASAVWMPHGYTEGKLYAVKGGAGADLSFTRNGTRTRKGPTYVEDMPYNLVSNSEDLTAGSWSKVNTTITPNATTDPLGGNTMDLVTANATPGVLHDVQSNKVAPDGGTLFLKVYIKAGTQRYLQISGGASAGSVFGGTIDTTTMTVVAGTGTLTQAANNTYLYTNSGTTALSINNQIAIIARDDAAFNSAYPNSTGGGTWYQWGASLSFFDRNYFKTTDRFNVPALDYTNGACPSLSLDPSRTNLCLRSESFDNAAWVLDSATGLTVAADNTTAPNGLIVADKLSDTGNNVRHAIYQSVSGNNGVTYTWSVYAKSAGQSRRLGLAGFGVGGADEIPVFNLESGTVTLPPTSTILKSASIVDVGNGWYRCIAVATTAAAGDVRPEIFIGSTSATNVLTTWTYVGTGAGLYVWGAQIEVGSYATSYIPTTSATVSRIADSVNTLTGVSSLIGQTEGTLYTEFKVIQEGGMILTISSSTTNRILIYCPSGGGGQIIGYIQTGGAVQANIIFAGALNTKYKAALVYSPAGAKLFINGASVGSDGAITLAAGYSSINVGANAGGTSNFYGNIFSSVVLPTACSDAEAIALTTP